MEDPAGASRSPGAVLPHEPYRASALVALLRLHWFIRLRWIIAFGALLALALERYLVPEVQRPLPLVFVVLGVAAANLLWVATSRVLHRQIHSTGINGATAIRTGEFFANAQVALDLFLLTLVLRYTGGVENPMALFYLFHMAIGSLLLERWQAILQGVWAVLLYAGLVIGEWQGWLTPHHLFLPTLLPPGLYDHAAPVLVACAVLACGVFGVLHFTLHIAGLLDLREDELVNANRALQQSQIALQDLQARRSRFLQTAAHQLKSPLALIQTLAGLIRDGIVPPAGVQQTCERIIQRSHDGIDQVTELLTLARVQESDPSRHKQSATDAREIVLTLGRQFAPLAERKLIDLSIRAPEDRDLHVLVHPADLRDCVANLIDNAIKYTTGPGEVTVTAGLGEPPPVGNGGPRPPESIAPLPAEDYVWISVQDSGMGIELDSLHGKDQFAGPGSIFDAFRRGNGALAAGIPGSGLGLSIVREIVEQAGGRMRVYSRPGHGSTFTVLFPARHVGPFGPSIRDTRSSEIVIEPAKPAVRSNTTTSAEEASHAG